MSALQATALCGHCALQPRTAPCNHCALLSAVLTDHSRDSDSAARSDSRQRGQQRCTTRQSLHWLRHTLLTWCRLGSIVLAAPYLVCSPGGWARSPRPAVDRPSAAGFGPGCPVAAASRSRLATCAAHTESRLLLLLMTMHVLLTALQRLTWSSHLSRCICTFTFVIDMIDAHGKPLAAHAAREGQGRVRAQRRT
jgi:hypothetical protein